VPSSAPCALYLQIISLIGACGRPPSPSSLLPPPIPLSSNKDTLPGPSSPQPSLLTTGRLTPRVCRSPCPWLSTVPGFHPWVPTPDGGITLSSFFMPVSQRPPYCLPQCTWLPSKSSCFPLSPGIITPLPQVTPSAHAIFHYRMQTPLT